MKQQTGVRVDAELWRAYRDICTRYQVEMSPTIPAKPLFLFFHIRVEKLAWFRVQ